MSERNTGCNLCEERRKHLRENKPTKYDVDLMTCGCCGWTYQGKIYEKLYSDDEQGVDDFLADVIEDL